MAEGSGCWLLGAGAGAGSSAGISEFKWAPPWGGRHCNWKWELGADAGNWQLATTWLCNLCNISCNCHFSSMASFILPLAKCQVPFRPCLPLFILLFICATRSSSRMAHFLNFHSHSHSLSHPSHLLHRKTTTAKDPHHRLQSPCRLCTTMCDG